METLPPRQKQVLKYVIAHRDSHGTSPTLREIAKHLDINGTLGVIRHLEALEKKGFIKRNSGSRGIIVVGHDSNAKSVPIVGMVRAGALQPAIEDLEGYFSIDSSELRSGGSFFLRVKGDSMIGACIVEGDLALIRPQPTAENRDIVVAMIDGEATLKRFFKESNQIRLQPENPLMKPIIIREGNNEVSIIGKVIGLYRALDRLRLK
jgi:repressor LexA